MTQIAVECIHCKNSFVESEAHDNYMCIQCQKGYYWRHFSFGSGTQIVQFVGDSEMPHYYVHASNEPYSNDHQRSLVCRELVAFLNRDLRPAWLKILERHPEYPSQCKGTTPFGLTVDITAVGPLRHHLGQPTEADKAMQEALITKLLEPARWERNSID